MENLFHMNINELLVFALILLRMTGFVVAMPVIGTSNVPVSVKVLLSLTMTFILFPQIGFKKLDLDFQSLEIITVAVRELFLGLCFGFIAHLFFMAISMAGQIMSVSLGISAAQLFNPTVGENVTALDHFYIILATLFFLTINGHHLLISGLFDIYQIVPISQKSLSMLPFKSFGSLVQHISELALKISTPILISILFMNIAIAIIGRAVPQINILITSLPINILSGFFVMFIGLPLLVWQMNEILNFSTTELLNFFKAL